MKKLIFVLVGIFINAAGYAQLGDILIDANQFWQINVTSSANVEGAKINLHNFATRTFLRMGSFHENYFDMDPDQNIGPFIAKEDDRPLLFLIEDQHAQDPQEYMRITKEEELRINSLGNILNKTKNVIATPDGTLKVQDYSGYSGILALTPHDFVSYSNPGDDQNFNSNSDRLVIFHENQLEGVEELVAPIHLPQGSIIRQINIMFHDNSVGDTLTVELFIRPHLNPDLGSSVLPIGKTYDGTGINVLSNMFFYQINNEENFYYLIVGSLEDRTDWPGENLGISSAIIYYDIGS